MDLLSSIETAKWFAELVFVVVVSLAAVVKTLSDRSDLDLRKTLDAASDAYAAIRGKLEEPGAPDVEALLEDAVGRVEALRKKRLPPKLRAKAKARIASLMDADPKNPYRAHHLKPPGSPPPRP